MRACQHGQMHSGKAVHAESAVELSIENLKHNNHLGLNQRLNDQGPKKVQASASQQGCIHERHCQTQIIFQSELPSNTLKSLQLDPIESGRYPWIGSVRPRPMPMVHDLSRGDLTRPRLHHRQGSPIQLLAIEPRQCCICLQRHGNKLLLSPKAADLCPTAKDRCQTMFKERAGTITYGSC